MEGNRSARAPWPGRGHALAERFLSSLRLAAGALKAKLPAEA